ncbi:hypothetical protein SAMN04488570_1260 [Nocardioides scoriae]|uniref:Secreted protein n=2 Tax=Nocardioides scoriae TaxID=642780 RepID=A0A1H1PX78_9ACTN|nr:hypothetical protein SAMN04488570_1260 [Nocardioides scoriae]
MQAFRTTAVVATALIAALTAVPLPASAAPVAAEPEPAPVVAPRLLAVPGVALYSRRPDVAWVAVRYQCTNNAEQVHYLSLLLQQPRTTPNYNAGLRNDGTGLREARCTGAPVSELVRLVRTSYEDPAAPGLRQGPADLQATISPRSIPSRGGPYVPTGPDVAVDRSVFVVAAR